MRPDLKNAVQTLVQHENVAKLAPPDIGGEFHMIRILRQTLFALGLAFANTSAFAAPVTFNFTFDDPASHPLVRLGAAIAFRSPSAGPRERSRAGAAAGRRGVQRPRSGRRRGNQTRVDATGR